MKHYYKVLILWIYTIAFLVFNYWIYHTLYIKAKLNQGDKFLALYIGSLFINMALSLSILPPPLK